MAGQRIGLWGGSGSVTPPVDNGTSEWEVPLLWDAPAGWESWAKVYVPPKGASVAGYDTFTKTSSSTEPDYPCLEIRPPVVNKVTQRNFVVVMPRKGDKRWTDNTPHAREAPFRQGAIYLNGGNNVVFATERPDGTLRRGGFAITIPHLSPFPTPYPYAAATGAAGKSYVHDDMKQTIVLWDDTSVDQTAIVDITGCFIVGGNGSDVGEGITGGTRRKLQVQRTRIQGHMVRCAADRAGKDSAQRGYVPTSGYAKLTTWTHPDGHQVWRDGMGEGRFHDVTFHGGMGGFAITSRIDASNFSGVTTPAKFIGDYYLNRLNIRSWEETFIETGDGSGNLSTDAGLGTKGAWGRDHMALETCFHFGTTKPATIRNFFPSETDAGIGTVYVQRPSHNPSITTMLEPNDSGDVDTSNIGSGDWNTEGVNATTDAGDPYFGFTSAVNGNAGDRMHQKWNGKLGTAKVITTNTYGKLMLGLPLITQKDGTKLRRDYAPASRWGSAPDWNGYEE